MKTRSIGAHSARLLAACATWLVLYGSALAQVEQIGPITLDGSAPYWQNFENEIPPNPLYKILEFVGSATNDSNEPVRLDFAYDYLDQGQEQIIIPGNSPIMLQPGGPHQLSPGPVVITDYCPLVVSLHVESDGPVTLQGQFRHICVPEPATASLILAGSCLCLLGRGRRR